MAARRRRVCARRLSNGKMRTGRTKWRDMFTSGVAFDAPMTDGELCALWPALRGTCPIPGQSPGRDRPSALDFFAMNRR